MLSLEVLAGRASGTRLEVGKRPLELGREAEGEGRLAGDRELSRRHARLFRFEDGGLVIEDLGSTNGTFVNGERITEPTLISEGDTIAVGDTTMRIVAAAAAPRPAADVRPAPDVRGGVHTVPSDLLSVLVARAPVKREWIVRVFLTALPIVLAVNFIIRTIAVEYLDVPDDIEVTTPWILLIVSFMPTLGNSVGFYFNFGRPADKPVWIYLVPAFSITAVITTVELILLPSDAGFAEFAVTILISAVAPSVIVPMLLGLRVRAALAAERSLRPS
jgi:hypothetical protein